MPSRPSFYLALALALAFFAATPSPITFAQSAESDIPPAEEVTADDTESSLDDGKKPIETKINVEGLTTADVDDSQAVQDRSSLESHELDVVLEENKLLKEFQSDLLTTVYWSLGIVIGVLLLIAGYNWYASFRMHERDRQSLKDDVSSMLRAALGEQKELLSGTRKEMSEELDAKLDRQISRVNAGLVSGLDNLEEKSELKLANFETRYATNEAVSDLNKVLTAAGFANASRITVNTLDISKIAAWMWRQRGIPVNALSTLAYATSTMIADDNSMKGLVKYLLDDIEKVIDEDFLAAEVSLDSTTRETVEEALEAAESFDAVKIGELRSKLDRVPRPAGLLGGALPTTGQDE